MIYIGKFYIEPLNWRSFHGLNLNPIPLEFSQEFDTYKILSALAARISAIENMINVMQDEWEGYTDDKIAELKTELTTLIDDTKRYLIKLIELNRSELDDRITNVYTTLTAEMLEKVLKVEHWLRLATGYLLDRMDSDLDNLNNYIDDLIECLHDHLDNEVERLDDKTDTINATINDRIDHEVGDINDRIDHEVNEIDTRIDTVVDNLRNKIDNRIAAVITMIHDLDARYQHIVDLMQNQINELYTITDDLRFDHNRLRHDFDTANMYVVCPVTGRKALIQNVLEHLFDYHREAMTYGYMDDNVTMTYGDLDYEHSSDPAKNMVDYELMIRRTRKYFGIPEVLPGDQTIRN